MFTLEDSPLKLNERIADLKNPGAGAMVSFEGWVRDVNEGKGVERLEYEAYAALAAKEGQQILEEARSRFDILDAFCVHRLGKLEIGEMAVWVGVCSPHRDESFVACRYIIDEVKLRVPIWKKEHYVDGTAAWVACHRCGTHAHSHPSS